MFGLGITEIVVILVVALLFIGPEKLPDLAKSLGRGLREIRKATDDIKDTVNGTVTDAFREVARPPSAAQGPLDPAQPPPPGPPTENAPVETAALPAGGTSVVANPVLPGVPEERVAAGSLPPDPPVKPA